MFLAVDVDVVVVVVVVSVINSVINSVVNAIPWCHRINSVDIIFAF